MSGSGDEVPDINEEYIATFNTPAGTLHLPHLINIAGAVLTGFVLIWFSGAIRLVNGIAELGADLISMAFMPAETILRQFWTSPTEALNDTWAIATASIGDNVVSFVVAIVAVIAIFWLITTIVEFVIGGDEA